LAVEPCPEIEPGRGRVITGKFTTSKCPVLELRLVGEGKPLEPTPPHRFKSLDRLDWIPAEDLRIGETLQTKSGQIVTVESIRQKPGLHRVHNFEVEGEHHFFVGESGVLVHNAYQTQFAFMEEDLVPNEFAAAAKAQQLSSYSETDLSRFALDFRVSEGLGRNGNVVVIEYELNGAIQPPEAYSTIGAGGRHGEFIATDALPTGASLTRLFSERQPCQLPIPNCQQMLARDFPNAEITFLVEYGDQASRIAGNDALDNLLRGLGL
jgi:hypothetical protein